MIEVINPGIPEKKVTISEMKIGVLYKRADGEGSTVFLKTLDGNLIWFEPDNRINNGYLSPDRQFVRAPEGTTVIIKN